MSHLFSWSGSNIRWGEPFRLRHITTGKYLALNEDEGLAMLDREKSDTTSTAFCFRASKVNNINANLSTQILDLSWFKNFMNYL